MQIKTNNNGETEITECFSGVGFVTQDGEKLSICMRDSGYEFCYEGIWYEAKNGQIRKLDGCLTDDEADGRCRLIHIGSRSDRSLSRR